MTVVPLDRRFIVWTDKETGDPEVISYLFASPEALNWEDLLAKHRVVVLAEAGSGKSTELNLTSSALGRTRSMWIAPWPRSNGLAPRWCCRGCTI